MRKNKQRELAKLFDEVVAFQRDPEDPLNREIMQEHKKECLIVWGNEAMEICKKAMRYVEENS